MSDPANRDAQDGRAEPEARSAADDAAPFDNTNGVVDGLHGDDAGTADADAGDRDPTAWESPLGADATTDAVDGPDSDPAVTPYSEDGAR
ncbi:hypothetical protein DVJ78_04780 [Humibacter sp. BT305]|nr:hypothetical protein DVJ78_04780 [Humibacter sp. BT305]